jgi:hypothetical protein
MSRIAPFCADYIGKHGPAPVDALYQAAHAAGVTTARTPSGVTQALRRSDSFVQLPDGRYTTASRLLVGATFTHRIRGLDNGAHFVWAGAELEPLQPLLAELGEIPVEGGGAVRESPYRSSVWMVPPRVVDGVPAGRLVGFRWTGSHLCIEPVELDPTTEHRRVREIRAVLIRHRRRRLAEDGRNYRYGPPEKLARLVLGALAEAPTLFAEPVPPLDELLGRSPAECLVELYRSIDDVAEPEHRIQVQVDLPEPLLLELESRAGRLGVPPEDFIAGLLGHEMWRTAPRGTVPFQSRYEQRRQAMRDDDPAYDDVHVRDNGGDRHLSVVPTWDEL